MSDKDNDKKERKDIKQLKKEEKNSPFPAFSIIFWKIFKDLTSSKESVESEHIPGGGVVNLPCHT